MNPQEQLEAINKINKVHTDNANSDDGDKYLSQADYAMEAIDAVLNFVDPMDSPVVRGFLLGESL